MGRQRKILIQTFLVLAAGALLCGCSRVAPKAPAVADDVVLGKAVTNFFTVMDQLVVEVPQAKDAAGAVKALDSWTDANNSVIDAGEALVRQHPNFETNPPPWLVEDFARCTRLATNHTPVVVGIGNLIKEFHRDPGVAAAIGRYQRSLTRLDALTRLGLNDRD